MRGTGMNNCEGIRNALPLLLLGEADPPDAGIVSVHLEGCAACRAEADRLRTLLGSLTTAEVPDPDEAYWQAFLPRLRSRIAAGALFATAPRFRLVAAWAASVAVLLLAGTMVGRWSLPGGKPAPTGNPAEERSDPEALRRALEDLFPAIEVTVTGNENDTVGEMPAADELEKALDTILPAEESEIYTQVEDLPPDARRWLVQALNPGRG